MSEEKPAPAEEDDDELSLAPPPEDVEPLVALPEVETPPGKAPEPIREEEEEGEEEPPPPRLVPFDALAFFAWPFRGENAFDFAASLFVVLLILCAAWVVRFAPLIGGALSFAIILTTFCYFLTYPVKVARVAAEGRGAPEIWPRPELGEEGIGSGFRLEGLLILYGLLPAVIGFVSGSRWATFPLAVAGYSLLPAALLNLAVTGSIRAGNPVAAYGTARAGGRIYLLVALGAGGVMLLLQFLAGLGLAAVWVGVLNWLALVYTALAMGLLSREREELGRRLQSLAGPLPATEDA